jgi:hypothetical protein
MTGQLRAHFAAILERAASELRRHSEEPVLELAGEFGIRGYVSRLSQAPDGARLLAGLTERAILEAAEEISGALSREGVAHFFVKGIALVERVYRVGEREMADIDLQVSPSARANATHVLMRLGYQPIPEPEQGSPAEMRSGVALQRSKSGSPLDYVAVDLRWGIDPLDRLLPRPEVPVPERVWRSLDGSGALPVPDDAMHAVLIVHHLVHHDMLHLRGLLDLALLWSRLVSASREAMTALAAELGVLRALRLMDEILSDHFGLDALGVGRCRRDSRYRRALHMLEPVNWCVWAARAPETEFVETTMRRIYRRLIVMDDLRSIPRLVEDALIPPEVYLRWRWPEIRSLALLRLKHVTRVVRKSVKPASTADAVAVPARRS